MILDCWPRWRNAFDGSDQSIPSSGQCLDILRRFRAIAQSLTELSKGGFDTVLVLDNGSIGPQLLSDLFLRHQLPGTVEQQEKNLDWLPFQPESGARPFTQFTGTEIEFERSKANRV